MHRHKADRVYERKLDGRDEAHLIALICSDPPEGCSRWSLHLLVDHPVALNETDAESISHETVQQVLKNTTAPSPINRVDDQARPQRCIRPPNGGHPQSLPRIVRPSSAYHLLRREQ
ncbi:hypothetical protein [Natronococcus jeotgali]|uniref:hypothetical protein n=1 Tax=Natronococcus jeotgali TaxID=413812 RepID=UPI0031B5787C